MEKDVMDKDVHFRILLVVLSIILHLHHRMRGQSFERSQRVYWRGEMLFLLAMSLWGISLFTSAAGVHGARFALPLPESARWIGVFLMIACLALSSWIYGVLGASFSTRLEVREQHVLIRTGPYRFIRHPMYTTFFICAGATVLVSADAVVAFLGTTAAFLMRLRAQKEEEMLVVHFGDTYRTYQRSTNAFLPWFRADAAANTV